MRKAMIAGLATITTLGAVLATVRSVTDTMPLGMTTAWLTQSFPWFLSCPRYRHRPGR
jgi:hypothetical protein